jgi:hypothetical protein
MRLEVVTAVTTKIVVIWNMTPCSAAEMHCRLIRSCCLHLFIFFYSFYISILFIHIPIFILTSIFIRTCFSLYFHFFLQCPPVHSETAGLKGPILFLCTCTSTSQLLACPQHCPHMRQSFPHTTLLIYSDDGSSTLSRNVSTLLPHYTTSQPKIQQSSTLTRSY